MDRDYCRGSVIVLECKWHGDQRNNVFGLVVQKSSIEKVEFEVKLDEFCFQPWSSKHQVYLTTLSDWKT